jgi:hypothetical protein
MRESHLNQFFSGFFLEILAPGCDGSAPGPGWRKFTAYRQTGPGDLPLALRLS